MSVACRHADSGAGAGIQERRRYLLGLWSRRSIIGAMLLLAACATQPTPARDAHDPFERVNRATYRFNVSMDRALLRPVARSWRAAAPRPIRAALGHLTANRAYPGTILNDFLQGKVIAGGRDLTRLAVNSVMGLGFFDPASRAGLERHHEDFGQTLGKWGVPSGPFLMLPLLGPSTMRDAPTTLVDEYTDGRHYISSTYARWGLWGTSKVEAREQLLDFDAILDGTYDPYAFVRNAYLQRREYDVRDGAVTDDPPEANETLLEQ